MTTTNNKDIYIYSTKLDQSFVITKLIKKYQPDRSIIGIITADEFYFRRPKYIDKLSLIDPIIEKSLDGEIIPTGAASTQACLEKKDVTIGDITLTQSALKVFDKPWLLAHAKANGIPVPTTWEAIDNISTYPIFYKQKFEKGGGARGFAITKQDIPKIDQHELIFQELISDKGTYGVSFLAKNGTLLCKHGHFESESLPQSGGTAVVVESFSDEKLIKHTEKLIKSLEFSGWGLAEFKYCSKRNDYVLMEINAKFWASCELALLSEPKFLKLLFNIDTNESPPKRIFFIDRAFHRGFIFLIINIRCFLNLSELRMYPGWVLKFLQNILPEKIYFFLRKMIRK